MSDRPWLDALKATMRERGADTDKPPEKILEALPSEGCERCESPADVPPPLVDMQTAEKIRGSWGEEERRLIVAGWKPKERGGRLIWANPETGFYCSQEVALRRLEAREVANVRTFATQKSARVMDSGKGVSDGRNRCR
jgi:hypothetical protein